MPVIEIKNISKSYILKHKQQKNDTIRDTIVDFSKNLLRKKEESSSDEFWALKNISLNVEKGDRLGWEIYSFKTS
jgi:lipopolysaccharide transport system ATP-binding protein